MTSSLGLASRYVKLTLMGLRRSVADIFRPDPNKVRRCVSCRQMFIGIAHRAGGAYACSDDCAERHWRDNVTFQP